MKRTLPVSQELRDDLEKRQTSVVGVSIESTVTIMLVATLFSINA